MDSAAECAASRSQNQNNAGETVMTMLAALWLPILLGAVFVFVASSIIHMAPLWHKNDFPQLPDENRARAAIGALGVPPGEYMLPRCKTQAEMRSPEFLQKLAEGPVWIITVRPNGSWGMGKALTQWFVYILVIAVFAAYVAAIALPAGTHYLTVFRVVGTVAFIAFSLGLAHDSIWYARKWSTTFKLAFDGLIYALVLAGTFGWLWPKM
jgi:hypothetical protein